MSNEFQVNTTPGYSRSEETKVAEVVTLGDGNVVVAWEHYDSDTGNVDGNVRAQIIGPDGSRVGSEFEAGAGTSDLQLEPAIAVLDDGGFILAWSTFTRSGSTQVNAQFFDSDGDPTGAEIELVDGDAGVYLHDSVMAPLSHGGFVAAWLSFDSNTTDPDAYTIEAQLFDSAGTQIGAAFQVHTSTTDYEQQPAIARLSDDRFVVAWNTSPDQSSNFIGVQIFDAAGQRVGSEIQLSGGTWSDYAGAPALCALDNGNFLVIWADRNGSDNSHEQEIKGQLFNSDGQMIGAEIQINTVTQWSQYAPSATALADGGFVVSWTDGSGQLGGTGYSAITAQLFDADGSKTGSQFRVDSTTQQYEYVDGSRVAALADGGFLIAWYVLHSDGWEVHASSVKAAIYYAAGNPVYGPTDDVIDLRAVTGGRAAGGAGDDRYRVDDAQDAPLEQPAQGVDQVESPIDWTLGAHIERLTLVGTDAVDGTGNARGNLLVGNDNDNTLRGLGGADTLRGGAGDDILVGSDGRDLLRGGAGNDRLAGGTGADQFVFDVALSADTNVDVLTRFVSGSDRIVLDDDVFTAFDSTLSSSVTAAQFHAAAGATTAQDAEDRIIYDTQTGALYYDADGLGGAQAIHFATLGTLMHPAITAADITIAA